MAIDYAVLKTELQTDPRGYGYAAFIASGNDTGLAGLLNTIRDGTNGAAISINRGTISTQELVEAIVQSEMPSNASQRDWLIMVASGARVRVDNSSTARSGLLAIFGVSTVTRTNLTTIASRNGSRMEELFGVGTIATVTDVSTALRGATLV